MAEPLKATFFAFRRRERRGVLWRAFFVHTFNAASLIVIMMAGAVFYLSGVGGGRALMSDFGGPPLIIAELLLLLLFQLNGASFDAACLRWLLRDEQKGFLGSSFDRDAWRIVLGEWLWAVLLFGCLLLAGIVAGVVAAFVRTVSSEVLIPAVAYPFSALTILLLTVRLGCANALGLAKHKFSFFEAWQVSKGRFWALFGSWLIAAIVWVVTYVVIFFLLAIVVTFVWHNDNTATGLAVMSSMLGALLLARLALTPLIAGINARTVLAAAEEGRVEGFQPSTSVARVFE